MPVKIRFYQLHLQNFHGKRRPETTCLDTHNRNAMSSRKMYESFINANSKIPMLTGH